MFFCNNKSLTFLFVLFFSVNLFAQNSDKLSHLGVVGEFSYYKETAETHALRIFNHKAIPDSVKSVMITKYNAVRAGFEQITLQLISDMQTKRNLSYFRKIDKYFYKGKKKKCGKVKYFIENWLVVKKAYDDMISFPTTRYLDSMSENYFTLHNESLRIVDNNKAPQQQAPIKLDVLDPIGSIGSLFKIYKRLSLINEQKAVNITELLNALRLRHASELIAKDDDNAIEIGVKELEQNNKVKQQVPK